MSTIVTDGADTYCCYLPQLLVVNLSGSNIKLVRKLACYGFNHTPLALKGHIPRYTKLYFTHTYNHNKYNKVSYRYFNL